VPQGRVEKFQFTESKVFPDTTRDCWIYIPAQYDGSKPAALMVFQDGGGYASETGGQRVPIVFDNLIAKGEMPVTIGVFINPGAPRRFGAAGATTAAIEVLNTTRRDTAKFLNEFLPFVLRISVKPTNDSMRAIGGTSSGAICAFTVAWERPNSFRKVLSQIGSFTNIRGGHVYPSWIRKTERKPLRVFLQDGSNDLNNLHGNWPLANQRLPARRSWATIISSCSAAATAASTAGDPARHAPLALAARPCRIAQAAHQDNLGGDEALSKCWRRRQARRLELIGEGYGFTDAACSDAEGNFYFSDLQVAALPRRRNETKPVVWLEGGPKISGMKFGADELSPR
jgi:enterochelin esterase family protein